MNGTADFEFMLFGGPTGGIIIGPSSATAQHPLEASFDMVNSFPWGAGLECNRQPSDSH